MVLDSFRGFQLVPDFGKYLCYADMRTYVLLLPIEKLYYKK